MGGSIGRFFLILILALIQSDYASTDTKAASQQDDPPSLLPAPTPRQYVYHEQERIMFACIDPCTWQGREYDDHSIELGEMKLPKLDTDQWCEAALAWGARQILFVAKHTGGFCWWQTDTTDYSVKNIAWRNGEGDLVEELAQSCGKHGLNMGIYVYPGDATWGAGIGSGGRTKDPNKQEAYNQIFRQQLEEAIERASRYTKVTEVWFDGSCVIEVGDVLEEHAPDAVIFQGPHASIRWVGNERGYAPYPSWSTLRAEDLAAGTATAVHSSPDGDAWAPLECDTPLYDHNWFWSPANEKKRKGLDELMNIYYKSVGRGGVMLLNATPNTDGLIPEADLRAYQDLGAEIKRRFGHPLRETSGRGESLELDFKGSMLVNHVIIMEDYRFGERIRKYVVEGWDGQRWLALTEGRSVGRKRIDCFDDVVVSKVRLRVPEYAAEPLIRKFQVFHVTSFRLEPDRPLRSPWTQCGSWSASEFDQGRAELEIDLTPFIPEAGQYRVRFKIPGGKVSIRDEALLQQGQASTPGILKSVEGAADTFHISRTAAVTEEADIRLKVILDGRACPGVVLIRRFD